MHHDLGFAGGRQRHQLLARLHHIAWLDRPRNQRPVNRRPDDRLVELRLCHAQAGARLRERRLRERGITAGRTVRLDL
ncbi:hypothetical protein D3C83_41200 [compost metagenome]